MCLLSEPCEGLKQLRAAQQLFEERRYAEAAARLDPKAIRDGLRACKRSKIWGVSANGLLAIAEHHLGNHELALNRCQGTIVLANGIDEQLVLRLAIVRAGMLLVANDDKAEEAAEQARKRRAESSCHNPPHPHWDAALLSIQAKIKSRKGEPGVLEHFERADAMLCQGDSPDLLMLACIAMRIAQLHKQSSSRRKHTQANAWIQRGLYALHITGLRRHEQDLEEQLYGLDHRLFRLPPSSPLYGLDRLEVPSLLAS